MLSIVVYGRNDNHGYNLHKRAAISLNCLAEMLGEAEDELIFVDYNTPDDLPTFPEAIADTLTSRARARLRILRVRPRVHRRFQPRTHLAALEPVARNVGVRASNPANRWILSTNTDIVLVPRAAQRLAEAVGELPAGFYHTARFEIPEGLWETFDRADPIGTIAAVRALGVSARLNEVVYGSDPILYDGPGDFQLVLRADLFAIDGFDERMILGWHVDSNLAKRLTLKRGPVASLIDQVFCYHCDHTRQATSTHRRDRLENDAAFFVDEVARPDLPEQRQHWGCAGDEVEEIGLAQGGFGYRQMLERVVAPLDAAFSEARYTAASFDDYRYDARHVLPFLADLLSSYPRGLRLGWCGVRRDMFELARQAWRHLGFVGPILVEAASAAQLVGGEPNPELQIVAADEWLDRADLLVFEFGRAADGEPAAGSGPDAPGLSPAAQEALSTVASGFLSAVLHERSRLAAEAGAAPRRFVGINCIHNSSEKLFAAHIAAAATPFSSRLRHGFVVSPAPELDPGTVHRLLIGRRLGRPGPISRRELALARDLFLPLLEGRPIEPLRLHRAAINAAIGEAFVAAVGDPAGTGQLPPQARRALAQLDELRPSTGLGARLGAELGRLCGVALDGAAAGPGARPLSRFAAYEDWDDPAWSAFGLPYATDPRADDAFGRHAGRWEQVHLLYGLDRAGKLAPAARVLVVATLPDAGIAAISWRVAQLDLLPIGAHADSPQSGRRFWCAGAPYRPAPLAMLDPATDLRRLEEAAYDAIVFPHGALFAAGFNGALRSLELARPLLRPDGVLAFKAEIAAGSGPHPDFFDIGLVGDDGLAARLAASIGLVADGGFDPRLSRATIDRVWPPDGPPDGPSANEGYFLTRRDGRVLIPSLWFLRREEIAGCDGDVRAQWRDLRRWLGERWLGEQLGRLHVGAAGRRGDAGRIETRPGQEGHVFYGPYLTLPDGRYRATLQLEASPATRSEAAAGVLVEVAAGPAVLASRRLDRGALKSGVLVLEFGISPEQAARDAALEIRLYSPADFSATFTSVDLRELPSARQAPFGQLGPARSLPPQRGRGADPAAVAKP